MINENLYHVNYLLRISQHKVANRHSKLLVDMPITFGAWLRDKIKAAGLSNAEVARRSGYSDTHIGNLLRDYHPNTKSGHGGPSVNAVEKIARAVGADLDEARLAAGYAPLNEIPVLFHNEDKLTDEERVLVQQIINRFADAHIEDDE